MDNSGANGQSTNLSPEPEQVIGKADKNTQASLEEVEEEEEADQHGGKNLHWVSTEMDDLMLWKSSEAALTSNMMKKDDHYRLCI